MLTNHSLAMAEMTMLMSAVYRKYSTELDERQKGVSPGITSRFEVFSDSTLSKVSVSLGFSFVSYLSAC